MATLAVPKPLAARQAASAGRLSIMTIFGTRPEAVKMAPVVLRLRASPEFVPIVVTTGQHREMLDQVTRLFGITPDVDLDIMRPEQSLVDITTRALAGLHRVLDERRPEMVLVQGDAHTTFIGALAAYYHRIPVGPIEAGLRTYDRYQPFPEEMNRRMTSALADVQFAPTARAKRNLLGEGIPEGSIFVTGNTAIDALQAVQRLSDVPAVGGVPPLGGRWLLLATTHPRGDWGGPPPGLSPALRDLPDRF